MSGRGPYRPVINRCPHDIFHLRDRAVAIARRRIQERRNEWLAVAFVLATTATPLAIAVVIMLME